MSEEPNYAARRIGELLAHMADGPTADVEPFVALIASLPRRPASCGCTAHATEKECRAGCRCDCNADFVRADRWECRIGCGAVITREEIAQHDCSKSVLQSGAPAGEPDVSKASREGDELLARLEAYHVRNRFPANEQISERWQDAVSAIGRGCNGNPHYDGDLVDVALGALMDAAIDADRASRSSGEDTARLDWVEKRCVQLDVKWDDDNDPYTVHQIQGNVNDRVWVKVGEGNSYREALDAARRGKEGTHE